MLKKANIFLCGLNAFKLGMINVHDHRKIVVVDGRVAFCGGINIVDKFSKSRSHGIYWKDSGVLIEGDAVQKCSQMFLRMWEFAKGQSLDAQGFLKNSDTVGDGGIVQVFSDSVFAKNDTGKNLFNKLVSSAESSVFLSSPYLVLDEGTLDVLMTAALCGVDVRIVVPALPQQRTGYQFTQYNIRKLAKAGVKIFKYKPSMLHSKLLLVDGEVATIGSLNLNFRSFYNDFENQLLICSSPTIKAIQNDFDLLFENSRPYCEEGSQGINKFILGILKIFRPLF